MKKSFQIVAVRPILNIDKPIVVFELAGADSLVRNPKQALVDLQNSGRALNINPKAFANGIENANATDIANFTTALLDCQGAVVSGDMTFTKAGDSYVIRAGHPVLTDNTHPSFGKVKEGDSLKAEKDGVWVDGFLSIPLTEQEKMRRDVSGNIATALMALYGFGGATASAPVAIQAAVAYDNDTVDLPTATADEAFGKAGKQ